MTRTLVTLAVMVVLVSAGCGDSPSAPSSSPSAVTTSLAGKPGPTTTHAVAFSAPDATSPYLVGSGTVDATVSGTVGGDNYLIHGSAGAFTLTIQAAATGGPAQDVECTDGTLKSLGLIGSEVSGTSFTVDFDQDGSKSITAPLLDWTLSGAAGGDWRISGLSTNNFTAEVVSDSDSQLVVRNRFAKVLLSGPPLPTAGGKRPSGQSYGCRVHVEMTFNK